MSTDRLDVLPLTAPVDADIAVPGSKSYTNRALICAALARGTSTLTGPLVSEDTAAMLDCLAALGIDPNAASIDDIRAVFLPAPPEVTRPGRADLDLRVAG